MLKVEGSDSLVRDPLTNAIINVNENEYSAYIERQKLNAQKKQQINNQAQEIMNMKQELSEIKQMLVELITKSK